MLPSCFCGSIISMAAAWHVELALRIAIASIVGLITIIGGRVIPALTSAYAKETGGLHVIRISRQIERTAAIATACALVG